MTFRLSNSRYSIEALVPPVPSLAINCKIMVYLISSTASCYLSSVSGALHLLLCSPSKLTPSTTDNSCRSGRFVIRCFHNLHVIKRKHAVAVSEAELGLLHFKPRF